MRNSVGPAKANTGRKTARAAAQSAPCAPRRRTLRGMLKSLSLLLAVLLLTAAFPLSPAHAADLELEFEIRIGMDYTPGKTSVCKYTYSAEQVEQGAREGTWQAPQGYVGDVYLKHVFTEGSPDFWSVRVGDQTLQVYQDGNSDGSVPYNPAGYQAAILLLLNGWSGPIIDEIPFEIPAFQEVPLFEDITINGQTVQADAEGLYRATGIAGENKVEISGAAQDVHFDRTAGGDGQSADNWVRDDEDELVWTINLEGGEDAELTLRPEWTGFDLKEDLHIAVSAPEETPPLIAGVMVNGRPAEEVVDGNTYLYTATVNKATGNEILIEAPPGVSPYAIDWDQNAWNKVEEDWKRWTLDFTGDVRSAELDIDFNGEQRLEIIISFEPPPVTSVTVNGVAATGYAEDGIYYYSATVDQAVGNGIEIGYADGVEIEQYTEWGGGTWVPNGQYTHFTLDLPDGEEAELFLFLPGSQHFFTLHIANTNEKAPEVPLIEKVTVNGLPVERTPDADGYFYNAEVNKPDGNEIKITPAEGTNIPEYMEPDPSGGEWVMGNDWTTWTLGSLTADELAELSLWLVRDEGEVGMDFTLTVTYIPQSSGGGGGGGEGPAAPPEAKAPEVNVINETNQPNVSSDTVLTPANTTESGGQSTTTVTSAEVQAMIDLAEAHSDDVPDGDNEAIIRIEDQTPEGNDSYVVNLSGDDVAAIAGSSIDILSVSTGASEFRMRSEALGGLGAGSADTVQIRLSRLDHRGKPGVDAMLVVGEKIVTMVDGVYTLEIRIPYKIQPGEDPNSLCIEYLREDGETELVTESRYDPERQTVSFFPSHLSKYGVAYRPVLYSDVKPGHWANSYITFLAARDVITNAPGTKYRPDDAVTRAEFINMAARAFSAANLGKRSLQSYRDVPADAWYARAVGWSYMNNISPVLASGGNFYPDRGLNREETATLANNISLSVTLRLRADNPARFSDAGAISSFAQNATARMAACGIIPEAGGGRFLPKGNSTRADAARSISLMLAKMR